MNVLQSKLISLAERQPSRIVLRDEHREMTAADLLIAIEAFSHHLSGSGASRVGLLADNSIDWAIIDLASQFAGVCLVPVPTFFSDEQIEHVLRSAAVELLFMDAGNSERVIGATKSPSLLSEFYEAVLSPSAVAQLPPGTTKITFTSGSTGEPKGVCLSFAQCLTVAASLASGLAVTQHSHLAVLPLSTLLENIGGIYLPLLEGGQALLISSAAMGMTGSSGIDPAAFLHAVDRYEPETMILVPQLLALFDSSIARGWQPPSSLKFVAVGGGRVAPAIVSRVRAGGMPIYEGYGLSECASVVSLNMPGADRSGTSGRVLPHVTVSECEGELSVSGNAFLGYLNQPDSWGVAEVATGDLGRVDSDGFVVIEGRSKNVFISSFGRNISPEWVESELLASGVLKQAVLLGDSRPFCTALTWSDNEDVTLDDIDAELQRVNYRLPDYARVKAVHVMPEPLSSKNGLLTENGRPRRGCIGRHYQKEIDKLYEQQPESIAL